MAVWRYARDPGDRPAGPVHPGGHAGRVRAAADGRHGGIGVDVRHCLAGAERVAGAHARAAAEVLPTDFDSEAVAVALPRVKELVALRVVEDVSSA